jgi:hypothetical protein
MRNSRPEFCEQIVSKFNRNAFRLRRKAFVIRNLLGCGGLQPSERTLNFVLL